MHLSLHTFSYDISDLTHFGRALSFMYQSQVLRIVADFSGWREFFHVILITACVLICTRIIMDVIVSLT